MKKIIVSIAILFTALAGRSQSSEFTGAMQDALGQYASCKNIGDFQALGNKFGLIANAEKTEWLPYYNHAYCYIIMSFIEQQPEAAKKDSYLDIAEQSISKILELAPKEAEVYTLQSMFYSARLMVDPMARGQKFGMLSGQSIGKAIAMEPGNPRAKLMKLRNDMGSAQFFGKDPKEFCPQASELLAGWDNYKVKSPLYPAWGKDQAAEIVQGCK
jgi:hypothetical protein